MLILGVDPGLIVTGYGVIEADQVGRVSLREGGVVRAAPKLSLEGRLRQIHEGIREVLAEHRPEVVAVEDLYSKYEHPKTAILMGHARGVVYLAAGQLDVPVVGYTAATVKKALTGSGRASKTQVQAMVQRVLGLEEPPHPDHVADALALALCHANAARPLPAGMALRR